MERTQKAVQILTSRTLPHALPLPPFLGLGPQPPSPHRAESPGRALEAADERPLRALAEAYRAWGSGLDQEAPATVARWIRAGWEMDRLARILLAPAP